MGCLSERITPRFSFFLIASLFGRHIVGLTTSESAGAHDQYGANNSQHPRKTASTRADGSGTQVGNISTIFPNGLDNRSRHEIISPDRTSTIPVLRPWVLDVTVISSRRLLLIKVDDRVIFNVSSEGMTERDEMNTAGMYFAVLNQDDGRTLMTRVFDMHHYSNGIGFPSLVKSIAQGRIMIFAVKTEAALNMPYVVRKLLQDMGSRTGHALSFRSYWAWVVSVNGPSWGEAIIYESSELQDFYMSPIYLSVSVPLTNSGTCWDVHLAQERKREYFCLLYAGYGNLCHCHDPAPLEFPEEELENSQIKDVPLGIITSSRPQALYRCLVTILSQKGGSLERIIVLLDGYHKEAMDLLELLGVHYKVNDMSAMKFPGMGARISHHYRFSLHAIFSSFPMASRAIILEEDLLAAPDFFSYFNQTSWLLDVDPSLFCISAWNDLGALHISHHPHRLYRVETHAGYGWMLTRQFFDEIYPVWKSSTEEHDWDVWLRDAKIRGGRECIIPDVSRTFHNSASGAHIKTLLAQAHFVGHAVTSQADIVLHRVDRMIQEKYEEDLYGILESDNIYYLNTTLHPCSRNFLPRNFTDGPVVIFMEMDNHDMNEGWKHISSCLGIWHIDTRSHHRGLFRFTFYGTEVFVIGYPFSDYSYLKPNWVRVTPKESRHEDVFTARVLMNRVRFRKPDMEALSPYLLKQRSTPEPIFRAFVIPSYTDKHSQKIV